MDVAKGLFTREKLESGQFVVNRAKGFITLMVEKYDAEPEALLKHLSMMETEELIMAKVNIEGLRDAVKENELFKYLRAWQHEAIEVLTAYLSAIEAVLEDR
jgi:hypothetical protein